MNNYQNHQKNSCINSTNNLYDPCTGFIRGNMFPNLYSEYKLPHPYNIEPINEQAHLLTYIDAFSFAAHDLNLYLDTHPDDHNTIELFNQYSHETTRITNDYEKKYGPILLNSDALETYPWAWNNSPWPWDNQ